MGYIFKNLRPVRIADQISANQKAIKYLKKAESHFKKTIDEEGLLYCSELRLQLNHKLNNGGRFTKTTSHNGILSPTDQVSFSPKSIGNTTFNFISTPNSSTPTMNFMNNSGSTRFKLVKENDSFNLLLNQVDLDK